MVIKTYRAPDLAMALERARRELGPNALVMATREEKGSLGMTGVEVTVGVERPRENDPGDLLRRLARQVAVESERRGGSGETPRASAPQATGPRAGAPHAAAISAAPTSAAPQATSHLPARPAVIEAAAPAPRRNDVQLTLDSATQALISSGLDADLALRFSRIAEREAGRHSDATTLARATERAMAGIVPLTGIPFDNPCLIVAGPPGVGKTTTAAKLTARARGEIWFASADQERIGAVEQARIFAATLGARFESIRDGNDLKRLLDAAPDDVTVIVDTPGISAQDDDRLEQLGELRDAAPDASMVVMMPAGMHRDAAVRTLERFDSFEPDCAAFSKVDDGGRVGELVTALLPTRIPLSFTTHGHRVPDDLSVASARGLVSLMLRPSPASLEAAR